MSESKEILRQEARRHRTLMDISADEYDQAANLFFETIAPEKNKVIAAYWPTDREFDPRPIIERLLEEGYTCVLPVMQEAVKELKFALWNEDIKLVKSSIGVFQPAIDSNTQWLVPDILIVPLLAFDRRGYRLGQGGGHYDATLKSLRGKKEILAVGLAYGQQACLFKLPVEEHDQRLDWVITPQGTHYFDLRIQPK